VDAIIRCTTATIRTRGVCRRGLEVPARYRGQTATHGTIVDCYFCLRGTYLHIRRKWEARTSHRCVTKR